jgi:hypothetical protein
LGGSTTRPTPPAADVEAHVASLDRRGLISERDVAELREAGYDV